MPTTAKRHLSVIQPRRIVLLWGAAAVGAVACRADGDIGYASLVGPDPNGDDATDPNMSPDDGVVANPDDAETADAAMIDPDTGLPVDDASITNPTPDSSMMSRPDVQQQPPPDVQVACTPSGQSIGSAASFTQGTWRLLNAPSVIVGRDSGGLFAFSSLCTHRQCVVDPPDSSGQTYCACHGSIFDGNGAVVQGPARTAMQHYGMTVCNGIAYVNTATRVAATTRTPG